MFATLIIDTDTLSTALTTHDTLQQALDATAAAATWMHPTEQLRLLEADTPSDNTTTWSTRAEMASYYGGDERALREAHASTFGRLLATYPSPGPHPLGERGFIFTGDTDLLANPAA